MNLMMLLKTLRIVDKISPWFTNVGKEGFEGVVVPSSRGILFIFSFARAEECFFFRGRIVC